MSQTGSDSDNGETKYCTQGDHSRRMESQTARKLIFGNSTSEEDTLSEEEAGDEKTPTKRTELHLRTMYENNPSYRDRLLNAITECVESKMPSSMGIPTSVRPLFFSDSKSFSDSRQSAVIDSFLIFPDDAEFIQHFDWSKPAFRRYDHFMRILSFEHKYRHVKWSFLDFRNRLNYGITIIVFCMRKVNINPIYNLCMGHWHRFKRGTAVTSLCQKCYFLYVIEEDNEKLQRITAMHTAPEGHNADVEVPTQNMYEPMHMEIKCADKDDYFKNIVSMVDLLFCRFCLAANFSERVDTIFTKDLLKDNYKNPKNQKPAVVTV